MRFRSIIKKVPNTPIIALNKIKKAIPSRKLTGTKHLKLIDQQLSSTDPEQFEDMPVTENINNSGLSAELLKTLLDKNKLEIAEKIDQRFDKLSETLFAQDKKNNFLQSEVVELRQTITQMSSDNEKLWCEVNKLKIVIVGLNDAENESDVQLNDKINLLFKEIVGEDVDFDYFTKIGKFQSSHSRIVNVRFNSYSSRAKVFENRLKTKPPIFLNDNFPASLRKDHAVIRAKKKSLLSNGYNFQQIKIDWN